VAHHKSAKKRVRQNEKRQARNRHVRSTVRTATRKVRSAADAGDSGTAAEALRRAESVLRRAASKGVVHPRRASRQISRLARRVDKLSE